MTKSTTIYLTTKAIKLVILIFILTMVNNLYSQTIPDSTYIYDKYGNKHWYYIQKDVYCFKLTGDTEYTGILDSCVANFSYWAEETSKFNEINFDSLASLVEKTNQISNLQGLVNYLTSSIALTKSPYLDYTHQEYFRTDDLLMVTFNDPLLDQSVIDSFATVYGLDLIHQPDPNLPSQASWTYIFKLLPGKIEMTTVRLAQIINETESGLVLLAEPNIFGTQPLVCQTTTEMGFNSLSNMNPTWYISNDGGQVVFNKNGINDADADICECWGAGYTGSGVKIGVIDVGGFEFSHPDFENSNIPVAYDALNSSYLNSDFYLDPQNGHAMQVVGIIAATPNNSTQSDKLAVGSAYNSVVIPYINLIGGAYSSYASNAMIVASIQSAILDEVDIINMSFKADPSVGTIDIQISNAVNFGRQNPNNPSEYLGIICVGACGNDNVVGSVFPANMSNVIGVGWSNPEDYRSSYNSPGLGGNWTTNSGQGSTYGPPEYNYDIVAPGEVIMTTNLSSTGSEYAVTLGSSAAAPIVSSIAAIILEKNPTLSWSEVREIIRNGADKVHPTVYDYNMYANYPGYNNEMFYGRVSCINSLNLTTTAGIDKLEDKNEILCMKVDQGKYSLVVYDNSKFYEIYDTSGKLISKNDIEKEANNRVDLDLTPFSKGMYFVKIVSENSSVSSIKLINE